MTPTPALVIERITLDEVHLLPGNPRRGDVDAVANSLAMFGQRTPIVVNRPGMIVLKGNHTVRAARQLEWDTLDVVFTELDEDKARAYALADNRTSELGTFDHADLIAMLSQVEAAEHTLALAAGWTEAQLIELLSPPAANGDRGSLLALADVTLGDPEAEVSSGEVWRLGPHALACCSPLYDWDLYVPLLGEGDVLACYPTPAVAVSPLPAKVNRLVLVQPDEWMASHLVDKYRAVNGEDAAWVEE